MHKKGKKGELSLNLIIVAVIGLLVLVIVAIMFMQRMGVFGRASNDCQAQGGYCKDSSDSLLAGELTCDPNTETRIFVKCYDPETNQQNNLPCCKKLYENKI